MAPSLRELVRRRAADRCEYCRIRQDADPFFTFHVEHVRPRQHGGPTEASNLALSCHSCNLHKGPNLTGIDPEAGAIVRLFNPRLDAWDAHFVMNGGAVAGITDVGRATVHLLNMNHPARMRLRATPPVS